MKNLKTAFTILAFWLISSCQMTELDLYENPNAATFEKVDLDELFHSIQLDFNDFVESTWDFTASLSRMGHSGSGFTYREAFPPQSLNETWNLAYAQLLPNMKLIEQMANEKGLPNYVASSQILKAYTLITLVDVFGDVPYNQALRAEDQIFSPMQDSGEVVYESAEVLLKEAIELLANNHFSVPKNDLFYYGEMKKWATLAKTIQLKMALSTRLVNADAKDKINALLAEGDLIDEPSEDFQFQYSIADFPDSRHPLYVRMYENPTEQSGFLSNYYIWLLRYEKVDAGGNAVIDPRIRFYFYRQARVEWFLDLLSCSFAKVPPSFMAPQHYLDIHPDMPFCYVGDHYYGRDHMNASGIAPDFPLRTAFGLYPMGGKFDDDSFNGVEVVQGNNAKGKGINPILLSSYVDFMRAEAALVLGTNDDARALLLEGIEESFDKVIGFKDLIAPYLNQYIPFPIDPPPTYEEYFIKYQALEMIDPYLNYVSEKYDTAPTIDEKLNVIIKEYLIALWGNGIEAYNNYRRTCMPFQIQPTLEPFSGDFARSAFYPSDHANLNENIEQKEVTQAVFWDVNTDCLY